MALTVHNSTYILRHAPIIQT